MSQTEEQAPPAAAAPPEQPGRRGLRPLEVAALVLGLAIVGVVLALVISGPSKPALPGNASASATKQFAGLTLSPPQQAPPLQLRNYAGDPVDLAADRGKAVFVTFLYAHCPDVCPLIAANLRASVLKLGPQAADTRVIAVSVDPRGDTSAAVAQFTKAHGWTPDMKYLIGAAPQLARVWKAWNVGSAADVGNPSLVNHSALVYGISATGVIRTIYDAQFAPAQIVHDVPLLLKS
jgi:protein SCO1/2